MRSLIFYPMLWARPVFLFVAGALGGIFTLGAVLFGVMAIAYGKSSPHSWFPIIFGGCMGFGIFVLRRSYDSILLKLNPTGHDLYLWQR